MVLPIGREDDFIGVVDLLTRKAHVWPDPGNPEKFDIIDPPEDMLEAVEEWREKLIETAVEQDDDLMEQYLEGNEPSIEDIKRCVRQGTRKLDFFPTYCGSAFKDKGVQLVLDAVVDYLPDPTEVDPQPLTDEAGEPTGEMAIVSPDEPLRMLAFKIMDDRFGALTFVRVYSGILNKGDTILNSFTGKTERIGRMVEMHANDRKELDSAQAGDIIAIVGMKNVQTGHTLCDPKHPCTLEAMGNFPEPVISIAVAPRDKAGAEKMGIAIGKMVAEDPSFRVETDEDSGETILKGMGELHLDVKVDILKRTYGVELDVGKPQVAYRETITEAIEDSYTHKKQTGGSGQFGKIDYRIKPGESGSGYVFASTVVGGNVPKEFFPAIEKGFGSMMQEGPVAGFPVLDVEIELYDGAFHAVDSSAVAFELAARGAYRQSMSKAGPQLIEPIMKVDVFTPDDHVGDVIGDLNRRRGMIKDQDAGATGVRIKADGAIVRDVRLYRSPAHHEHLAAASSPWSFRTICLARNRLQMMSSPKLRSARRRDNKSLVQISRHFSRLFFALLMLSVPGGVGWRPCGASNTVPLLDNYGGSQVLAQLPTSRLTIPRYARCFFKRGILEAS